MFNRINNNSKNDLLEISQKYFHAVPPKYAHFHYGPAHDSVFVCICTFQEEITSHQGRTKKEAEMACSSDMIEKLTEYYFDEKHHAWGTRQEKNAPVFSEVSEKIIGLSQQANYQVLSLLGNAVLRAYIANYLFDKYSQFQEGILTQITSRAMSKEVRSAIARNLDFNQHITFEATERKLAEFFDATVGLLALQDRKDLCHHFLKTAYQRFIEQAVKEIFESELFSKQQKPSTASIKTDIHNHKGDLFQLGQSKGRTPSYTVIERAGSAHSPEFRVKCCFNRHETEGSGTTIKSAEQDASKEMLSILRRAEADTVRTVSHHAHHEYAFSIQTDEYLNELARNALRETLGWKSIRTATHLNEALTHPSKAHRTNYQRLEFLGDALLKEILLLHVIQTYPSANSQSDIADKVSFLVSAPIQAEIASQLKIDLHILAETTLTEAILSDVLEAVIAAIHLDEAPTANVSTCVTNWYKERLSQLFECAVEVKDQSTSLAQCPAAKASYAQITQGPAHHKEKNLLSKAGRWTAPSQQSAPDLSNPDEFPAL